MRSRPGAGSGGSCDLRGNVKVVMIDGQVDDRMQ